ncbi:MAG: hypothetical protein MI810_11425 [Flavobacteriales bacterium]|nr:hypothetical protein [Flavobacteriales bacterium]
MKKIIIVFIAVLGFAAVGQAQVNKHALGGRLARGTFFGAEVSYQYGFNDRNRLELDAGGDIGIGWSQTRLSGIFHWDWNIVSSFNWYIGPGAQLGFYADHDTPGNSGFTIGVGGQVGFEFDFKREFDVPILVSIDTRPMVDVFHPVGVIFLPSAALSARYVF